MLAPVVISVSFRQNRPDASRSRSSRIAAMPFQADLEVSRLSTVIITGGSSGLGQRTAAELAADPDRHVVITGRDAQRTHAAATAIGAEAQLLDLGALDDVRSFVEGFRAGERPPLRALICNAGVQNVSGREPVLSRDGYEETFA